MTEDRLEQQAKKKKHKKAKDFMILVGYTIILILIMYVGAGLFTWLNGEIEQNQIETEQVISQLQAEDYAETNGEAVTGTETDNGTVSGANEAAGENEVLSQVDKAQEILDNIKESLTGGATTIEAIRPFYEDELIIVSGGRFHFVPINEELKMNDYVQENLQILENGEYQYVENGEVTSHKGIDVSKFQGDIDWEKVAEDGVEFAFIRAALRGYGTGKLVEDGYFEENIEEASRAGVKVGAYVYTQAITEEEVMEEAQLVLDMVAPYSLDCPIVIDVEKVSGDKGRMNELSVEERTNLVLLFCQTIENAGYKPMIYHNMEMGALMLDIETFENYDKWFASYSDTFYYPYQYEIWQYSDNGTVDGIDGPVDLNISFSKFWEE